jgi:hypothetical protein
MKISKKGRDSKKDKILIIEKSKKFLAIDGKFSKKKGKKLSTNTFKSREDNCNSQYYFNKYLLYRQ